MKFIIIFCLLICTASEIKSQDLKIFNNRVTDVLSAQGKSHDLFKLSFIAGIKKGTSIGLSYGMWKEGTSFQYSLNTGFMWRFGKAFLGNYRNGYYPKDPRTKGQFVFMLSPMLTLKMSRKDYVYQELEPFYFGTPNAVFSKYRTSITLGSTFTVSPRGSYNNVSTIRNRAQQDFMIAINVKDINLTIYDDYFPFFTELLQLGDNWDRFFTGGGFLRFRFSDEFTMHVYSEVYTGINRSNQFLYPDVISYRKKGKKWLQKNFAYQDPGQEYFNSSWFIVKLAYTSRQQTGSNTGIFVPDMSVFVGTAAPWTMFSQNLIHSSINYDTTNHLKLHYFIPRTNVPGNLETGGHNWQSYLRKSLFIGAGTSYNILNP